MKLLQVSLLGLALLPGLSAVYAEGNQALSADTLSITAVDSATLLLLGVGALSLVIARRYHRHG